MSTGTILQQNLKLLWANPSPYENFAAQKIPLNLTNVDKCIVAFENLATEQFPEHELNFYDVYRSPSGRENTRLWCYARLETTDENKTLPIMMTRRYVAIADDGITISDASNKMTNKASNAGTYNNYLVPCAIYVENV